jgi:hypothetical protein
VKKAILMFSLASGQEGYITLSAHLHQSGFRVLAVPLT